MKKLGFTLSELLITLGIIGVAAALVAPAVTNLMPDKNKMMFIKNYNELVTITEKMLNDKELYYPEYEIAEQDKTDADGNKTKIAGRKYPTCVGLECRGDVLKEPYKTNIGSNDKFAYILSDLLGADVEEIGTADATFKTQDGTKWETEYYGDVDENVIYNVYYSVNSEEGKDCTFNPSGSCKNPNKFCFELDTFGRPKACDSLSKAYLLNPNNMHDKKRDLKCAQILSQNGSPEDCAKIDD